MSKNNKTTEWTHCLQLFTFNIDGLRRGDLRCLAFTDQDKNSWSLCIRPKELEDDVRIFIQLESVPEHNRSSLPIRVMYKLYLEDLSSRHFTDNSGLAEFWFYLGDESPQSILLPARVFDSAIPPYFRVQVVLACHAVDVLDMFSAERHVATWTEPYWMQLMNREHTDLRIHVGSGPIPTRIELKAHAHMVAAHCEVLAKQLQYSEKEKEKEKEKQLFWPQLSLPSATLLLRHLYSGQLPSKLVQETTLLVPTTLTTSETHKQASSQIIIESWEMWMEIFIQAHEWMLHDVVMDAAMNGLLKHVTIHNVEQAAQLATTYDIRELTNGLNRFIEQQSTQILTLLAHRGTKRKADQL